MLLKSWDVSIKAVKKPVLQLVFFAVAFLVLFILLATPQYVRLDLDLPRARVCVNLPFGFELSVAVCFVVCRYLCTFSVVLALHSTRTLSLAQYVGSACDHILLSHSGGD